MPFTSLSLVHAIQPLTKKSLVLPTKLRNSAALKRQSKHHLLDFSNSLTAFSQLFCHAVDLNRTVILQARSTAFGTE